MRIGITVDSSRNAWSSGMAQQACFIYDILQRAGAECYYICNHRMPPQGFKDHKYIMVSELMSASELKFDLILIGELPLDYPQVMELKKRNNDVKIIFLSFYNKLVDDTEKCLFSCATPVGPYAGAPDLHFLFDEVWVSPHHEYHLSYIQTLFQNNNVKIMPYIWDSAFIQHAAEKIPSENLFFTPENREFKDKASSVCIFEPNLSFSKNFLIPLSICERAYAQYKIDFVGVNVFNCKKIRNHKYFTSLTEKLSLVKDKKTYFNNRWAFIDAIERWGGAIVSHQTINELNYLHLECLYLGLPLIHNSKPLEEAGYFYEGFDIKEGADQLNLAILRHGELFDYYQGRAKECIAKYSIYNATNINLYQKLIS